MGELTFKDHLREVVMDIYIHKGGAKNIITIK